MAMPMVVDRSPHRSITISFSHNATWSFCKAICVDVMRVVRKDVVSSYMKKRRTAYGITRSTIYRKVQMNERCQCTIF